MPGSAGASREGRGAVDRLSDVSKPWKFRTEVVEWQSTAKRRDESTNEDRVVLGPGWFGIVDGATDKGGRSFGGRSSGWLAAETLASCLGAADAHLPADRLVADLGSSLLSAMQLAGADPDAPTRPAATVIAFSPAHGVVVRVGDGALRWAGRSDSLQREIDRINASARAALLQAALLDGADPDELLSPDPGRAMILPLLEMQGLFQNHPSHPLGFGAIDGRRVPDRFVEVIPIVGEGDLVLASDGYPQAAASLAAAEAHLEQALRRDPLCIGELRSTKGLAPGTRSFDDRSYLRLRLRSA